MTSEEFVKLFYIEKKRLLNSYFINSQGTRVGSEIEKLGLTVEQESNLKSIIDQVLTDTMYTILLGIDGEAAIGNMQQEYQLFNETGCKLTNCGEIEQYAYKYFYETI